MNESYFNVLIEKMTKTLIDGKKLSYEEFLAEHPGVDRVTFDVLRAKADHEAMIAWGLLTPIKRISQAAFDEMSDEAKLNFFAAGGVVESADAKNTVDTSMITNLDGSKSVPATTFEAMSSVLRAKVLRGIEVDVGEMANAIAADNAEAHLKSLEGYRDRQAELMAEKNAAENLLATLTDQLFEHDAERPEIDDARDAVAAAIKDYYKAVTTWNRRFQRLRVEIERTRLERARLMDDLAKLEGDTSNTHVGLARGYRRTDEIEIDGAIVRAIGDYSQSLKTMVDRLMHEADASI